MNNEYIFNFKSDLYGLNVPNQLNNPFALDIPEIAKIAAQEFQKFIEDESKNWDYDFQTQRGKMFGVLVIQQSDLSLAYLATVSGKIAKTVEPEQFIPSVLDESQEDFFFSKGMTDLSEMSKHIKSLKEPKEILIWTEKRRLKSNALQERLFQNYKFINLSGEQMNVLEIFKNSSQGYPPAAAGECAAAKLLQFALEGGLKPIAIAEFWWGQSAENIDREHLHYYPACKNKCRPILEYMLDDDQLFEQAQKRTTS